MSNKEQRGLVNNGRHRVWAGLIVMALMATLLGFVAQDAGATPPRPAVWFGAPMNGCNWIGSNEARTHTRNYGGDWAADICQRKGNSAVYLYAAPQNGADAIRAFVIQTGNLSCGAGRYVKIELRRGSTPIGVLTYAHLNLASGIAPGAEVSRWGGYLGTVWTNGSAVAGKSLPCWYGTPHIHFEALNYANYACYTKEWAGGGTMNAGNFMGYIGGWFASGRGARCP